MKIILEWTPLAIPAKKEFDTVTEAPAWAIAREEESERFQALSLRVIGLTEGEGPEGSLGFRGGSAHDWAVEWDAIAFQNKAPATAYVVTSGEYSDYSIEAVFSTDENAQLFIDRVSDPDEVEDDASYRPRIEEWPVDPEIGTLREGKRCYFVRMSRCGDVLESASDPSSYGFREARKGDHWDIQGNLAIHVFAQDEEHAVKIAGDRRSRALAENRRP